MSVRPNSAKSAELQIIIWFLEVGWELFTPVADIGSDMVIRPPQTRELLAVQIKHKQREALNEGLLRPIFSRYFLDLTSVEAEDRAEAFTTFFAEIHASREVP